MGSILSRLIGAIYMMPAGDGGGGGGGGAGGGGAGGTGGGGDKGGGGQVAFADAAAARGYLNETIGSPDLAKLIPDDHAVPFATSLKGRFDGLAKEFPATWRTLIAGDNAEAMKTLERFQTPKALYDSYGALRQKMSSGELRMVEAFPEKGNDEQKTAWRAANGIPASEEEYTTKALKVPDGVQLDDTDKATIASYAKAAFAGNVPPAAFNQTVGWYLQEKNARHEKEVERHANDMVAAEDALRAEMGQDYRPNQNRVRGLIDALPKELGEALKGARLPNGQMLLNNVDAFKWMVDVARQFNPAGVVLPAGGNLTQSLVDELKAIDTLMQKDRPAYNKDEKKQQRYRDLLDAYSKSTGKTWPNV